MSRYCSRCDKAISVCLCHWIQVISSEVQCIILQHKTESQRPLGSAKILQLSLPSCECFIGEDFSTHHTLNQLLKDTNYCHLLVYPRPNSQVLTPATISQINPDKKKLRCILIDATWKKAHKMWQCSANLQALPCIQLPDNITGNYRLRKAPTKQHLSTVEAGYHVLRFLDPEQDFSPLITAFTQMIDQQIRHIPKDVLKRNYPHLSSE